MIYPGANRSNLQYSLQVVKHIHPNRTKEESALFRTKWWDYRNMHPMDATHLFCFYYIATAQAAFGRTRDFDSRAFFRALPSRNLLKAKKGSITGLWRARQFADRFGIKYDFWCQQAFKYAYEFKWSYFPRANQLCSQANKTKHGTEKQSMVNFIIDAWMEALETHQFHAETDYYRCADLSPPFHPYQKGHMSMLLEKIEASRNRNIEISNLVYRHRLLPENAIIAKYGDKGRSMLSKAKEFV